MEAEKRRFAGIDLWKREYTMAIIGKNGKMSIHQVKTNDLGRQALYKKLEKIDKEDAMKLAHLIEERRDEKLPVVPLPSEKEMERRKIIANYSREVKGRKKMINLLHALLVHQGHTTIVRKDLSTA